MTIDKNNVSELAVIVTANGSGLKLEKIVKERLDTPNARKQLAKAGLTDKVYLDALVKVPKPEKKTIKIEGSDGESVKKVVYAPGKIEFKGNSFIDVTGQYEVNAIEVYGYLSGSLNFDDSKAFEILEGKGTEEEKALEILKLSEGGFAAIKAVKIEREEKKKSKK